jgi:uncharacterized protein (TIGR02246 family)
VRAGAIGLVALAAPVLAQDAGKQEMVATLVKFGEAWKKGDAAAVAAFFDENATFTSAAGEESRGRAAIQAGIAKSLSGSLKGTAFSTTAEGLQLVKPDVAVQSDVFLFRSGSSLQSGPARGLSHSLVVWVKRVNGWRILAAQGMVPARPAE